MEVFYLILFIIAAVCFAIAGFSVAVSPKLNFIGLGLMLVAVVWILQTMETI